MFRVLGVTLVAAVAASLVSAAEPPPLKGTFVREMIVGQRMGNQIVLTFDNGHLKAKLTSGARSDEGREGWVSFTFDGDYAVTPGGLICGVVTGMNADLSQIPGGDMVDDPIGKTVHKVIGEPFCFRARPTEKGLVVTDIKVPRFCDDTPHGTSGRDIVTAFACGTYTLSPADHVPLPKLAGPKANAVGIFEVVDQLFARYVPGKCLADGPFTQMPPPQVSPMPVQTVFPKPVPFSVATPPMPRPGHVIYAQPVPAIPDDLPQQIRPVSRVDGPDPRKVRADELVQFGFVSGPPGALSLPSIPSTAIRIEGGLMDDKPHDGTWVHEFVVPDAGGGMQTVLTFKGERLSARFTEFACGDDGKMKSGSFEFECSYHLTADGYVIGRVVGVELDMKNAPHELVVTPDTFKGLNKVFGEPFCFRCDRSRRCDDGRRPAHADAGRE